MIMMRVRAHVKSVAFALLLAAGAAQNPPDQIPINTPYVQTPDHVVSAMLKLARITKGDTIYDLGCGDGRIVIQAAKEYGAHGVGIDINPERIPEARANPQKAPADSLVKFELNDLFDADIHGATVVALYLLPDANLRLLPKLLNDLKPGTRVVSHDFGMGDWKPEKTEIFRGSRIHLWTIPAR